MNETPKYTVEDGSEISFITIGPKYQAVLTSPLGQIVISNPSSTATYEVLAKEVILNYTGGTLLKFTTNSNVLSSSSQETGTSANPNVTTAYDLSKLIVYPTPDVKATSVSKINNQITSQNNQQIKSALDSQLPFDVKLVNNVNLKKEEIRQTLIPFLISLLLPYGPQVVQTVINNVANNKLDKNKVISSLNNQSQSAAIEKAKQLIIDNILKNANCPSSNNISSLINKRNSLVRQINGMYQVVKTLSAASASATVIITAVKVGIDLALLSPYPLPPVVPDKISELKKKLEKTSTIVNIITLSLATFGLLLGTVLDILRILDKLLEKCSKNQNISLDDINQELDNFINVSTGVNNSDVIATQQGNIYKGFTLELKTDVNSSNFYPRRYAQALNQQGVAVLKTELSFASDPQVLLNELKFIIDSNPNLTAE